MLERLAKIDPGLFGPDHAISQNTTTAIGRSKQRKWLGGQDRQGDLAQTYLTISKRYRGKIKGTRKQELRSSEIKRLRQEQDIL